MTSASADHPVTRRSLARKCSHSRLESVSDCADYRHQPVAGPRSPDAVITAQKFGLGFVIPMECVPQLCVDFKWAGRSFSFSHHRRRPQTSLTKAAAKERARTLDNNDARRIPIPAPVASGVRYSKLGKILVKISADLVEV